VNQLVELDDNRRKAFDHPIKNKDKVKRTFDKSARQRVLQKGDLVLMWDKKREKLGKHDKFDNLWLCPYRIEEIAKANSFYLLTPSSTCTIGGLRSNEIPSH
jgi:hypothetical protein